MVSLLKPILEALFICTSNMFETGSVLILRKTMLQTLGNFLAIKSSSHFQMNWQSRKKLQPKQGRKCRESEFRRKNSKTLNQMRANKLRYTKKRRNKKPISNKKEGKRCQKSKRLALKRKKKQVAVGHQTKRVQLTHGRRDLKKRKT